MGGGSRGAAARHRADRLLQEAARRPGRLALQPERVVAEVRVRGLLGRAWRLHQARLRRYRLAAEGLGLSNERSGGAKFDLNDSGVAVIIGSGAGGGTLGNELAQKGVKVVILEAGARIENHDFINDEWDSFTQLAWSDMRTTSGSWRVAKDFANLPAWIVKAVGGSTTHWAGASLRFDEHEFRIKSIYGGIPGANLLDWPITLAEMEPWYGKAENKMGVTRTNGIPGLPGNNNFKVLEAGAKKLGYKTVTPETWPSTASRVTGEEPASRSGSASRAASPARNGRRCTPKSPRARPPGISRCGPTAWRSRSSMMRRAR